MKPITIVQGGQYGSEAKGAIASYLCQSEGVDYAVRTGGTNAGHTVYYGRKQYKCQQIPTGWTNPNTKLVIGAGSLVDPDILSREVRMVEKEAGVPILDRLYVDYRAGVHLPKHGERSTLSGRHHLMGATSKGCSEAMIDRVQGRGRGYSLLGEWLEEMTYPNIGNVCDTERLLNKELDKGAKLLLEGTQGTGLDLALGPYPYVTHKQTGPAQWMMEAGLSPAMPTDIVMVVRTYPIRVAGNSGPLPGEISWIRLAEEINAKRQKAGASEIVPKYALDEFRDKLADVAESGEFEVPEGSKGDDQHTWEDRVRYREALSELNACAWERLSLEVQGRLSVLFEMTTVTRKLRRVARLNYGDLNTFASQVRPHRVAVTFMNYEFPERWYDDGDGGLEVKHKMYLAAIEKSCSARVALVSWGPENKHIQSLI